MRYLYKRSRMARRRQRVRVAAQLGLVAAAILAWSAAAAGTLEVSVRNGFVTMNAHAVPLGEVLRDLSDKAGFNLVMKQDLRAPVTWRLENVPVDQAVTRLLASVSSVALYAPQSDGTGSVLSEVRILRGGNKNTPLVEHRTALADGSDIHAGPESGMNELAAAGEMSTAPRDGSPVRNQLASADASDMRPASGSVGPIDQSLDDGDVTGRHGAALKDAKRRPDMARDAMNTALSDPDVVVRQRAVQGLARLGGEESVSSLSRVLLEDPEPRVRRMAAASLGRISTESAFWALMEANSDDDAGVREAVNAALTVLDRRGVNARADPAAPTQ
jgi:hypothetical protein